jgi:hypothetical protein
MLINMKDNTSYKLKNGLRYECLKTTGDGNVAGYYTDTNGKTVSLILTNYGTYYKGGKDTYYDVADEWHDPIKVSVTKYMNVYRDPNGDTITRGIYTTKDGALSDTTKTYGRYLGTVTLTGEAWI